jgi:endonuclease-3 related protein
MEMFDLLFDHYGPQHWWPGETPLEVMVGAVLTQNTSWKNVEKAIRNLKGEGLLSIERLKGLAEPELARLIQPAGYYNIKARRLKNLIDFVWERVGTELSVLFQEPTGTLREALLSVKGVGRETADSILLYGARKPVFVVDAYTYRVLSRHGLVDEVSTYDEVQELFMGHLPEDEALFNEFHALIVRLAKDFCHKKPLCPECPLRDWGPVTPSEAPRD